MKKVLLSMTVIMLLSSVFISSCKKGEDDPFISLRSRNSRVIGTWVLKNEVKNSSSTTVTSNTNNVNNEKNNTTAVSSYENNFDGNTLTYVSTESNVGEMLDISYSSSSNSFVPTTMKSNEKTINTSTYTQIIEVELRDDYTYTQTVTKTNLSSKYYHSILLSTGSTVVTETDTTYSPANTITSTSEGKWYWLDSDDDKVIISAGSMHGTVKRLSNKEIVIKDVDDNSYNQTDYSQTSLETFANVSEYWATKVGIITVVKNFTEVDNYTQTWEAKK